MIEGYITNVRLQAAAASLCHPFPHTNTNSHRTVTPSIHGTLRKTPTDNHPQVRTEMTGLIMIMEEVGLSR
jgi:hypothetical protein